MGYCLTDYLSMVEALDYPKKKITVRIRTNDSVDSTESILRTWAFNVREDYAKVEIDFSSAGGVLTPGHNWDGENLPRIARIRQEALDRFAADPTDFFFVTDCDNFLTNPQTLRELLRCGAPIAAPMLEPLPHEGNGYSNFFTAVDANGYFAGSPLYDQIRYCHVTGAFEVPVVHCTYLVEKSVICDKKVTYLDGSNRYDFVVFADSARKSGVKMWILNDQHYGFLLHGVAKSEDEPESYRTLSRPKILEATALRLADAGITSEEIDDALVDTLIELQKRDLVRCYANSGEGYWKTTDAGKEALRRSINHS